jgi:hypothetical protein
VDDFCFLGTYLKLLGKDCDWETRQELVIPVKRLLTQLRTDQANLFTPEQRAGLASLIGISFRDVPLTLAVLKALEQIGDAQAIPAVQNLADQPKLLPHELDHLERQHLFFEQAEAAFQEVQEAARHCLPFLTENEARFQQSDTLLRPSSEKGLAQEELLRPAALGQETPPQLLLRASEQESHS